MPNKYEKNRNNTGSKGLPNGVRVAILAVIELIAIAIILPLATFLTNLIGKIMYIGSTHVSGKVSEQRFTRTMKIYGSSKYAVKHWEYFLFNFKRTLMIHPKLWLSITLVFISLVTFFVIRVYLRSRNTNQNQYGHASLASRRDINSQYKEVPLQNNNFNGIGGVPVSTRGSVKNGSYYIDDQNTNTLLVGKTRSGKGEIFVFPMIDLLSRATEQTSLVINDPKQELYRGSYETLRERGYDVRQLNLKDPTNSMGYNPLDHVIYLAKLGYYDEVQQEINTITTSIYADPNARDQFWNNSSINLMNALILALLDKAVKENNYTYINMYTAVNMLTRLGGQTIDITDDKGNITGQSNKLISYFEELANQPSSPYKDMAINAFQQSKFAGDKTAGNIYSSAMEKVKIYQQTNIAKLTGKSTLNLRNLGFPRTLTIQLTDRAYHHENATVSFLNTNEQCLEKHIIEVDQNGVIDLPFKTLLPSKFIVGISFENAEKQHAGAIKQDFIQFSGQMIYKKYTNFQNVKDDFTGEKIIESVNLKTRINKKTHKRFKHLKGNIAYSQLSYSEKPIALFLITPLDNPSYNQIASFFIDQSFNMANSLAINTEGGKTINRIHYIIDEFSNLPAVANMDRKVTLSLGMNILWTLVVQNLEQLQLNYSEQQAETIKDNCGNKIYLLSDSLKTAKEFSNYIGQQTIQVNTKQGRNLSIQSTNNNSFVGQKILDETDLLNLQSGECVIVRSSKRFNLKGKKIMPYPIFNEGKHALPMRWQLPTMSEQFNPKKPISALNKYAEHIEVPLSKITINDWNEEYNKVTTKNERYNKSIQTEKTTKPKKIDKSLKPNYLFNQPYSEDLQNQLNKIANNILTMGNLFNLTIPQLESVQREIMNNLQEINNFNKKSELITNDQLLSYFKEQLNKGGNENE